MDASERTNQRKSRTLFADKIIQQTIFAKGERIWIAREGGVHTGAGSMTYQPNFYNMQDGAIQTTPAELAALVDSVPNTFPDPPSSVTAALVSGQVVVSFNAPAYTGTTPITSYTVISNPGGIRVTGSSSPITVTGLTLGQTYTFTVTATNSGGSSAPSAPSNSVATATVPDAPTGVYGVVGNQAVTVYFTDPAFDGGSTIQDYRVTGYQMDISFGTITGDGSPISYTGLKNGETYTFTVAARNAVGYSVESTPSEPVVLATAPDAPTNLCVIPTIGGALLYFTAPYDGGSEIINYQYSTDDGAGWVYAGVTTSPVAVVGLVAGSVYPLKLRALNAVDFGAASTAVSVAGLTTFSPANISGMNVWLDGQAIAKVDLSGGKVVAWNDKSSAINNFTANAAGTITYDLPSGINDRPALNFTTSAPSTSTYLTKNVNLAPTNQLTVFLVLRQSGKGVGNSELFFTRNDYRYLDIFNNTNTNPGLLKCNVGSAPQLSTGANIITVPPTNAIISFVTDTTTYMYLNGATTDVSGAARGGTFPSLNTALDWAISAGAFLGNYGELMCYSAPLSTNDRQSVEGYLAWKWGLQGDLPVGHPYRDGPPAGPPPSGNLYTSPSVTSGVTTVVQSPFVSGNSYSFNGSGNYLNVVSDDSWDFGTGDFTIEWFQYQTDSNGAPRIFTIGDYSSNNISIACSIELLGSGTFYTWINQPSPGAIAVSSLALPYKSSWQHFAIVRRSGILRVYRNGAQIGSNIANVSNISNSLPLYFGAESGLNGISFFGGYLTNIRIVKGLAVYTDNFTTPTSALTLTPGANPYGGSNTVAIPDGFTKLLFVP